jgi:hypothetical protein
MDWQEFALSRQFIAEERVGKAARAAVAQEDEAFAAASKALQATRR